MQVPLFCPVCRQYHYIEVKAIAETNVELVCPLGKGTFTLEITLKPIELKFSKDDIKKAIEETDYNEQLWYMQEARLNMEM